MTERWEVAGRRLLHCTLKYDIWWLILLIQLWMCRKSCWKDKWVQFIYDPRQRRNNCEEISATRSEEKWSMIFRIRFGIQRARRVARASSLKRNHAGWGYPIGNLFMRANISSCRDFSTMMTIILWFRSMRHSAVSLFIYLPYASRA